MAPEGHNGGDPPGCNGWVPDAAVLEEPTAEGIHKDGDGPDQASDRVNEFAHLPGRSPVLADLGVTSLGLGHGPHLLPGSSPPRQGQRVIREEVPEKARQAYGMGCGGVDTIPTRRWGLIGAGRPIPATGDVPESIAHAIRLWSAAHRRAHDARPWRMRKAHSYPPVSRRSLEIRGLEPKACLTSSPSDAGASWSGNDEDLASAGAPADAQRVRRRHRDRCGGGDLRNPVLRACQRSSSWLPARTSARAPSTSMGQKKAGRLRCAVLDSPGDCR